MLTDTEKVKSRRLFIHVWVRMFCVFCEAPVALSVHAKAGPDTAYDHTCNPTTSWTGSWSSFSVFFVELRSSAWIFVSVSTYVDYTREKPHLCIVRHVAAVARQLVCYVFIYIFKFFAIQRSQQNKKE